MLDLLEMFFSKTWEFFSIKWPGLNLSIGSVFLAAVASVGALTAVLKMVGVNGVTVFDLGEIAGKKGQKTRGGNNSKIKISKERKGDTK